MKTFLLSFARHSFVVATDLSWQKTQRQLWRRIIDFQHWAFVLLVFMAQIFLKHANHDDPKTTQHAQSLPLAFVALSEIAKVLSKNSSCQNLADSAPMAGVCAVVFHNGIEDKKPKHPKQLWKTQKQNFWNRWTMQLFHWVPKPLPNTTRSTVCLFANSLTELMGTTSKMDITNFQWEGPPSFGVHDYHLVFVATTVGQTSFSVMNRALRVNPFWLATDGPPRSTRPLLWKAVRRRKGLPRFEQ